MKYRVEEHLDWYEPVTYISADKESLMITIDKDDITIETDYEFNGRFYIPTEELFEHIRKILK